MNKKKPENKLLGTELAFIDEYISNGYNATRAYMAVHKKASYDSARALSSKMLTKISIRDEIDKRFQERAMRRDEVLARLSDMARASHYHFIEIDEDGFIYFDFSSPEAKNYLHLIKSIQTKRQRRVYGKGEEAETWEGEWMRVELHDAKDALKLIGEHENLFKPEKGDEETFSAPEVIELIKSYEEKRGK